MKISVSILKEKNNINKVIDKLNKTDCDYIHLDIMDGTFTDNSSFQLNSFSDIYTNKKYDIHIMSTNLDEQIDEAIKLKPDIITFHFEATNDHKKYIDLIKKNNIKVGISINPETNIENIIDLLDYIDLVLIMSVTPGLSGQEFDMSVIEKLKLIKEYNNKIIISVDGGINNKTVNFVKEYVNIIVCGSYVTNSIDYQKNIDVLRM